MFDDDDTIRVYVPPGWPGSVRPPGSQGWLSSAESFLLDCCPAEYRGYPVVRRHPVVLARMAQEFVASQLLATRSGLTGLRASLSGVVARPFGVVSSASSGSRGITLLPAT